MAKRKTSRQPAFPAVSLDRATRLCRLLKLLGRGPQSRAVLTRTLRLGVRGYYRDLEVLRAVGIIVELHNGKYRINDDVAQAIQRLPFPDPSLNLGEARELAKGRSAAHKKIRDQLAKIEK
jgi:hypothetical protein